LKDAKLKIAIYSGEIPSTTFIERLILGLSEFECKILLFGIEKKRSNYPANIIVRGYKDSKFSKSIHFLRYLILLTIFRNSDKRILDAHLKATSKFNLNNRLKCYPILWYKPDVFHLQWVKGISDWMWVQEFDIKLVVSLRGAHINYSPLANKALANTYLDCFPQVNGFHAVSKAILDEAQKYRLDKSKAKVVYSGIDVNSQSLIKRKRDQVFTILSVGRSHWKKGYTYALDACAILKSQGVIFKYIIIGGNSSLELQYQVRELNLENCVELLGRQPFDKVQKMMKNADILLLPSVEEGIANVVLEAMAVQTIVLTTNCGGMTEVVTDGINGFMVPVRDSDKMAIKIKEVMALSENSKSKIKIAAIETIKKKHDKQNMVSEMMDLYKLVI
jgi:colanic acid/amylovoran biosynthesis glycosyltransferase